MSCTGLSVKKNKFGTQEFAYLLPPDIVDPNWLVESFTKISKLDEPVFHRHLEPQKIVLKGKKGNSKK